MSSINAQPIQAMYLPSQVHGNRLRFMFGIEVEFEGHGRQGLRLCYIGCSAVCYSQMFIVKPLRRHIHNCPFQFCHLELKISRLHDFGHHFFCSWIHVDLVVQYKPPRSFPLDLLKCRTCQTCHRLPCSQKLSGRCQLKYLHSRHHSCIYHSLAIPPAYPGLEMCGCYRHNHQHQKCTRARTGPAKPTTTDQLTN